MFLQGRNDKIEATHVAKAAIIMTGLWSCLGFRNSLSLGEKLRMNFSINYTYLQEIFNFLKSSLSLEGNCRSQDLHKQNTEYARLMDSCWLFSPARRAAAGSHWQNGAASAFAWGLLPSHGRYIKMIIQ